MATDKPKRYVYDATTDTTTWVEMTPEEIAAHNIPGVQLIGPGAEHENS